MERQILIHEDGKLRFHDNATKTPTRHDLLVNEVLVKVAYCGLCGSDLKEVQGEHNFAPDPKSNFYTNTPKGEYCVRYPFAMGHEFSGTIVAFGHKTRQSHPMLRIGDKVVINPTYGCEQQGRPKDEYCTACQLDQPNICESLCLRGLNAEGGGLSTHAKVSAWGVIPIPPRISLKIAALVQPLAISWHAVRISGFADLAPERKTAIVFGAGPIGLACILALIGMGATKIVVSEMASVRRNQALKIMELHAAKDPEFSGAAISPIEIPEGLDSAAFLRSTIDPELGQGASRTYDCAGVPSTFKDSLASLTPTGVAVNVAVWALHGPKATVPIAPMSLTRAETAYMGSMGLNAKDMEEVIDAIYFEKMPVKAVEDMITSIFPLERSSDALDLLLSGKSDEVKVLIKVDEDAEDDSPIEDSESDD